MLTTDSEAPLELNAACNSIYLLIQNITQAITISKLDSKMESKTDTFECESMSGFQPSINVFKSDPTLAGWTELYRAFSPKRQLCDVPLNDILIMNKDNSLLVPSTNQLSESGFTGLIDFHNYLCIYYAFAE